MNWMKLLACVLVGMAFGLFVAALLTPWYRVHNGDGTDTRMGLYDSHVENYSTTPSTNETITTTIQQPFIIPINEQPVMIQQDTRTSDEFPILEHEFPAATTSSPRINRPIQRLVTASKTSDRARDDTHQPYAYQHRYRQQQRALEYNDGWVIAMRVLLLITIILSFSLLIWTMYHAFLHDTDYGWDQDSSSYKTLSALSYILLFWGFLNGIIILALASAYGPSDRYDEGYAFNSVAFTLLLLSACLLCWPVTPRPMVIAVPVEQAYGAFGAQPYPYVPPRPTTSLSPKDKQKKYASTGNNTTTTSTMPTTEQTYTQATQNVL